MEDSNLSPKTFLLQKSQMLSSPNLHKQKSYLPSRYLADRNHNKNGLHEVLSSIQSNLKTAQIDKITTSNGKANLASPSKIKIKIKETKIQELKTNGQTMDFRAKPLKRQESDMLNFKEIFIEPRQEVLTKIQEERKKNTNGISKIISKQYEKLLQFENGISEVSPTKNVTSSIQLFNDQELKDSEIPMHFQQCIQILDEKPSEKVDSQNFYEEHIRIEPPDLPNSSIASTLTPGSGYAPSVPMNAGNITKQQSNLKELLMRAKAGMNTEDIQKQAHLSYFLGVVYQEKGQYNSALKFYRRFLGFARTMEDKIGMALGANRVAINYFKNGDINKSISFHNQNLKLSDNQNCFSGFYNLGICYRRLQKYNQSLEHFQTALQWANQRGQIESQCISYGQLAMTYEKMELYQQSLENFQKSLDICSKLKKTKLQLFNLRNILRITSHFNLRSTKNLLQIAEQAYQCSNSLEDKKMLQIFSCNIGIIKGVDTFKQRKSSQLNNMNDDIIYLSDD